MTKLQQAFRGVFLMLLLIGLTAGCSTQERLYNLSGKATFKGQPIPAGIMYFDPDPTKGGSGTQGMASIKDGKYTTTENGRGIRGGAYVIRITGFDGKSGNDAPLGKTLFNEIELRKELPAADSELDFDLPEKK